MSITVNCSIDLTEEELFLILQHRQAIKTPRFIEPEQNAVVAREDAEQAMARTVLAMEEAAVKGNETPVSISIPAGDGDYANTPQPEVIPAEPPLLPPKQQRNRAKTNGAEAPLNSTPLAPSPPPPEPKPLDEPAMRSLLSKVGAVHPDKVKAITNILEIYGGHRRLSECDLATWPTIAEEAQKVLAEYGA
jgi:hypothetical protein